jgi:hypothetical protein
VSRDAGTTEEKKSQEISELADIPCSSSKDHVISLVLLHLFSRKQVSKTKRQIIQKNLSLSFSSNTLDDSCTEQY